MILGMSVETFTQVHVILSLIGIVTGLIVLRGMLAARKCDGWTAIFLATTVLTSVTGFFFPATACSRPTSSASSPWWRWRSRSSRSTCSIFDGSWRWLYVGGAVLALYLNVFVLIVQSFLKVPALNRLAPTQSEPPFAVSQLIVLAIFVVLGVRAVKRFHPAG